MPPIPGSLIADSLPATPEATSRPLLIHFDGGKSVLISRRHIADRTPLNEEPRQDRCNVFLYHKPSSLVSDDLLRRAIAAEFLAVGRNAVQDDFDHLVASDSGGRQPPAIVKLNYGPTGEQVKDFAGRCFGQQGTKKSSGRALKPAKSTVSI